MKENYYEYLEISKNASQEIIEKAYKTLVKKYHPDLQQGNAKLECEEKLKKINEAYEVLSDESKKEAYDLELAKEEQKKVYQNNNENVAKSKDSNNYQQKSTNNNYQNKANDYQPQNTSNSYQNNVNNYQQNKSENYYREQQEYREKMEQAVKKAYYDAYIQDLKNRGYTIRYKKTFKDYIRMLFAILIVIFVCIIIVQIPFVKNFFIDIYNENQIIKYMVDIIIKIFNSIIASFK